MNPLTILTKAQAWLMIHEWCGGALARDQHNNEVDPLSDQAVKFSVIGAMHRVSGQSENLPLHAKGARKDFEDAVDYLGASVLHIRGYRNISDHERRPSMTQAKAMEWLSAAIAMATAIEANTKKEN